MIIVFSQPGCPQCRMVKMLLEKKNIPFEVCEDVDKAKAAGVKKTPTLSIDGVLLVGTDIRDYINTGKLPEAK